MSLFRPVTRQRDWLTLALLYISPLCCHLYRAIVSTGAMIGFMLSGLRDAAAAIRLFRKALTDPLHPQPRVIKTDQARLYGGGISGVKKEGILLRNIAATGRSNTGTTSWSRIIERSNDE